MRSISEAKDAKLSQCVLTVLVKLHVEFLSKCSRNPQNQFLWKKESHKITNYVNVKKKVQNRHCEQFKTEIVRTRSKT